MMNMNSGHPETRLMWLLAVAGLIPFVGFAILVWFVRPEVGLRVAGWQAVYAALILTFVGGLHWAFVLAQPQLSRSVARVALLWSVLPALFAWVVLILVADQPFVALAMGLLIAWAIDWNLYARYQLPALKAFFRVRTVASFVAALSLSATAMRVAQF
jgi:Protein of unknown function (DUF3429)